MAMSQTLFLGAEWGLAMQDYTATCTTPTHHAHHNLLHPAVHFLPNSRSQLTE